jgi:hypothetical protein
VQSQASPRADARAGSRNREAVRGSQGYQQAVPRRAPERSDGRNTQRWDGQGYRRGNDRYYGNNGYYGGNRYYRYGPPRVIVPGYAVPRRYYGPGGNFSVYFGWGSGYRFGSWYSGPVYGYVPPAVAYGAQHYYGDIRLQVGPRFAAVYVDGYYAGIVDDFDGVFQRLTVEAGRHEIEITAPGYESRFYEVYVDPTRTVDLHGDLGGPY